MTVVETSKELVLLRPLVFGIKSLGFGSMLPITTGITDISMTTSEFIPEVIVDQASP